MRTADAQADLSFRWAHISFCWFCHAQAQMIPQQILVAVGRISVFYLNSADCMFHRTAYIFMFEKCVSTGYRLCTAVHYAVSQIRTYSIKSSTRLLFTICIPRFKRIAFPDIIILWILSMCKLRRITNKLLSPKYVSKGIRRTLHID